MAVKTMEVVVCDFPHKNDRPAVARVTIDVCSVHDKVFADVQNSFECDVCGHSFKSKGALGKHKLTHNGG
jgi:hypothetical protein